MHYTGMAGRHSACRRQRSACSKSALSPEGLATVIFGTVGVFPLELGTRKQSEVVQAYTYRARE